VDTLAPLAVGVLRVVAHKDRLTGGDCIGGSLRGDPAPHSGQAIASDDPSTIRTSTAPQGRKFQLPYLPRTLSSQDQREQVSVSHPKKSPKRLLTSM